MFGKKKMSPSYDPAAQKPVLRCSICTGEQVAGADAAHRSFYRGTADPQPAGIAGLPQPVRHPRRLPH